MCKMTKYELSKIPNEVKVILETHFKNFQDLTFDLDQIDGNEKSREYLVNEKSKMKSKIQMRRHKGIGFIMKQSICKYLVCNNF